jgi:hypothetical protein
MKIRISDQITVEPIVQQGMVCPAGTAYWTIDYRLAGLTIHSATTGAIWGSPNVIAMLDRTYEQRSGTGYRTLTHRQAIIEAWEQIVGYWRVIY